MTNVKRNGTRVAYLDCLRGMAILIVVLGHAVQSANGSPIDPALKIIMSFWMPLFFLISGFSAGYGTYDSLSVVLGKKFIRLFVPYVCWAEIVYMIEALGDGSCSLFGSCRILLCSDFWFLRCLFLISVIFALYRWLALRIHNWLSVFAAFVVLLAVSCIPGNGSVLNFAPLFVVGYIVHCVQDELTVRARQIIVVVLAVLFVISSVLALSVSLPQPIAWILDKEMALTGSATICLAVQGMVSSPKACSLLGLCGRYSLAIYAVHWCLLFRMDLLHLKDFAVRGVNVYIVGILGAVLWLLLTACIIKVLAQSQLTQVVLLGMRARHNKNKEKR